MASQCVALVELSTPSPFALPLMVERFREGLSTEKLADRLQRILAQAQAVLDGAAQAPDVLDATNGAPEPRRGAPRRGRQSA